VKRGLIAALVLVGVTALFVVDLLADAGSFRRIEPHFDGSCRPLGGIVGAEDFALSESAGLLFVSSDDRRATARGEAVQGGIYALDLAALDSDGDLPAPRPVTAGFAGELHPHGIGLLETPDGMRLFVVNHTSTGSAVEILAWDGEGFAAVDSIRDARIHDPNDVLAVGPRSFYVTNDHGASSAWGRTLEEYLRRPWSDVVYFDGERSREVARRLRYANGIAASPDGAEVYVAATVGRSIVRYRRDPATGDLVMRERIPVGTGVDNILVDGDGNLWVGAHPPLLRFVAFAKDARQRSPSEVLWLEPRPRPRGLTERAGERFREVFLDDGSRLSGSSVAAAWGDLLLVGSVFDDKLLVCRRD